MYGSHLLHLEVLRFLETFTKTQHKIVARRQDVRCITNETDHAYHTKCIVREASDLAFREQSANELYLLLLFR